MLIVSVFSGCATYTATIILQRRRYERARIQGTRYILITFTSSDTNPEIRARVCEQGKLVGGSRGRMSAD